MNLSNKLQELELVKERHIVQLGTLLNKERSLAKALGEETLGVDETKIPRTATLMKIEQKVEELGQIFEEREEAMFAIKEEVVHLLDVLDLNLNATSVEELFIVNQEQFESLQPQDMESARQTLGYLRQKVEAKKQEVETLLDKLRVLYDCLVVPQEERSSLCIKEAFSLEELCKVDKVSAIREEVAKWQAVKKENMAKILGRSKAEIEAIWRYRMVGARTQQAFWRDSMEDPEEELKRIEMEVIKVREDLNKHEETLQKWHTFLERCRLAHDLSLRQQDPARLKHRGNALMQEEKDRKKVNMLPSLKEELLARVQKEGDILVNDLKLSEAIAKEYLVLEQIYENTQSTSTKKPISRSSRTLSKTATSGCSTNRPMTRANSLLGLSTIGRVAGFKAPASSSISRGHASRNRTKDDVGEPPRRSPPPTNHLVPTPAFFVQEASLIVPEASVLLSESSFTESVPLSSTFQDPAAKFTEVWAEQARVERIADQVQADKARLEKSTASLRRAQEAAALSSTRLPRPDVPTRKHRRSNSCSDLRRFQQETMRTAGGTVPTVVEEQSGSRLRRGEQSRHIPGQRLVRAASSTKLFVR